jgi:hypothetical protein
MERSETWGMLAALDQSRIALRSIRARIDPGYALAISRMGRYAIIVQTGITVAEFVALL